LAEDRDDSDDFMELEDLQAELANVRSIATIQTVNALVESLAEGQEQLLEKEYYDKDLGKTIGESLKKVAESLKPVDLSEIAKSNNINQKAFSALVLEVSNQNKALLKSISELSKDSKDDSKYQSVIKEVLSVVKRSNELISKGMEQIDYSKEFKKISDELVNIAKRPTAWTHDIFRNPNGRVTQIVSKIGTEK